MTENTTAKSTAIKDTTEGKKRQLANLEKGKATQYSSGELAARNGKKGGQRKHENERKRKTFAEALEILLQMPEKPGKVTPLEEALTLQDSKTANLTVNDAIMLKLICKAKAGDPKAIELIREQIGEAKPVQVESTVRIVDERKLKDLKKRIDKDPDLLASLTGAHADGEA